MPKHILVVDDNVALARSVAASLRNYQVTVSHNGPEALARAAALPTCDLLITDYFMPLMTGDELAARIHDLHPTAKTMLISGFCDLADLEPGTTDLHMNKPFTPTELRASVTQLIGAA